MLDNNYRKCQEHIGKYLLKKKKKGKNNYPEHKGCAQEESKFL